MKSQCNVDKQGHHAVLVYRYSNLHSCSHRKHQLDHYLTKLVYMVMVETTNLDQFQSRLDPKYIVLLHNQSGNGLVWFCLECHL